MLLGLLLIIFLVLGLFYFVGGIRRRKLDDLREFSSLTDEEQGKIRTYRFFGNAVAAILFFGGLALANHVSPDFGWACAAGVVVFFELKGVIRRMQARYLGEHMRDLYQRK